MIKTFLLLFVFSILAAATSHQAMTYPGTGYVYLYQPYTMGSNSYRWEIRTHWTGNFPNGAYNQEWFGPMGLNGTGSNNTLYIGGNGGSTFDSLGSAQYGIGTVTSPDILIRVQRDVAGVYNSGTPAYEVEIVQTAGGYSNYVVIPIIYVTTTASTLTYWLRPGTDADFVRMYSTLVQPGTTGTGLINPISVPLISTNIVEDWEFAGTSTDQNSQNAWVASSGSISYATSPTYAPAVSCGAQTTYKAGVSGTLSGSATPLDGGNTMSYLWQELPTSSESVVWTTSQAQSSPSFIAPVFGTINFGLTATDSSGNSSTCTITDGVVAVDSNNTIIYPATTLGTAMNTFVGPLTQWGKNDWPWFDAVHKTSDDLQIEALGPPLSPGQQQDTLTSALSSSATVLPVTSCSTWVGSNPGYAVTVDSEQILLGGCVDSTHVTIWLRGYRGTTAAAHSIGAVVYQYFYYPFWDYNNGPGTVSVSLNSATLIGVGTLFESGGNQAICNSNGTPIANILIILHHPTTEGRTGNVARWISGCTSDTVATLSQPWGQGSEPVPAFSNGTYSIAGTAEMGVFSTSGQPQSVNYYDVVTSFYQHYFASGIMTYKQAAEQLADTVFWSPSYDDGYVCQYDSRESCFYSRAQGNLGLWLRAMDSPPYSMIAGLRRVVTGMWFAETIANTSVADTREQGYMLATNAYLSVLDTDNTSYNLSSWFWNTPDTALLSSISYHAAANYFLKTMLAHNGYDNYWYTGQDAYGDWPGLNYYDDAYNSFINPGTSVTLTNGSATVTGNSTTWSCSTLANYLPYNLAIWFWHSAPGTVPSTNAGGDSTFYTLASCQSANQLTLTTPYHGTTCSNCGFEMSLNDGYVGWGQSAYSVSIAIRSLIMAGNALTAAGDTSSATDAYTLASNSMNFVTVTCAEPSGTIGYAYGCGYVNCTPAGTQSACLKNTSQSAVLGFDAEVSDSLVWSYMHTPNSSYKSAMDAMFNQMWAKPGTCNGSALCNSSVTATCSAPPCYMTQLDPTVDGFMLGPQYAYGPSMPKWNGEYFGFTGNEAWDAARQGGLLPSSSINIYMISSIAAIPNATKAVYSVTATNSNTVNTTCAASPCLVSFPRVDQPIYSVNISYESATNTVLAKSVIPSFVLP